MVVVENGHLELSTPLSVKDDEIAKEAIIYSDIATFLTAVPEILEKYPKLAVSIKSDLLLLGSLMELGHIVAG